MWPQPLGCIPFRFHMFCIYATNLDADGNLCFTHYICSGWLSTSKHNDSCPTSMSLPVTNLLKIQWVLVITKSSNFHGEVSSMNQIYSFKKSSHLSTQQLGLWRYDRHGSYHKNKHTFGLTFGNPHHTADSSVQSSIASQPPNDYRRTIRREWDLWGSNLILGQAPSSL